ncbi:MAG TPA: BREX system ATP-binding domain-containing protein [Terriglobales bacterium]|nr:BREX system ATP-binding domain-containing protein [Terriglobales bacterium]
MATSPQVPGDLSPQLARALIRTLNRGTAIAAGVRFIHVGHSKWLSAQYELLTELQDDGHADTKFVRGAYGAGKSHFLSVVQDHARTLGWMTSHVECKVDGVQIDRFETLYAKVANKLTAAEFQSADGQQRNTVRELLDRWSATLLQKVGVNLNGLKRPFDAEERAYAELTKGLLRSNLPPEFTKALAVYVRATLSDDLDVQMSVTNWLQGSEQRVKLPDHYLYRPVIGQRRSSSMFELKPIGKGTAREVMRGLLWLVRSAGYKGLVLCIDEVEEIGKLGNRRREDQALQALRDFVDNAGSEVGFRHFCMYLAATPEMFENKDYFPRYDALATRIQPVGKDINWRAPVVDLDRTPLQPPELCEVGLKIKAVHEVAYGHEATRGFGEKIIQDFVSEVTSSKFRIAKPRLLARLLVDELERIRQTGSPYSPPTDLSKVIQSTAERIIKEANA